MDSSHQTTYNSYPTPARVKITRRHHPLEGQTLEILRGGRIHVVVRPPDGTPMRVPRAWTDADGAPPESSVERVFSVDAMRDLIQLVDGLRQRPTEGSTNQ